MAANVVGPNRLIVAIVPQWLINFPMGCGFLWVISCRILSDKHQKMTMNKNTRIRRIGTATL